MDDTEDFSVAALVAPHPLAAAAGREVLVEGGSVIEAVIAAAAVSAVMVPDRDGLGGDAVWLFREAGPRGRVRALDARGLTGERASADRLRKAGHDVVPSQGPEAVLSSPGTVAGWSAAHELSTALGGRLPLARLLAPAVSAARQAAGPGGASPARSERDPAHAPGSGEVVEKAATPEPGPEPHRSMLADTLDYLATAGLDDFYRGDVARELAGDLEALDAVLSRGDLRRAFARWREPATLDFGRDRFDAPPLADGLEAAITVGLAAGLVRGGTETPLATHLAIEASKYAKHLIDMALERGDDPAELFDPETLTRLSARIDRARAARMTAPRPPALAEEGSAVMAVDRDGAAAVVMQSLGCRLGSGVTSRRTGVAMNNRGAAFSIDPLRGPVLAPGLRPPFRSLPSLLSTRDGRVSTLGATGLQAGTCVAQIATRLLLGGGLRDAVEQPRFMIGPGEAGEPAALLVEDGREPTDLARLRAAGHIIEPIAAARIRTACAMARLPSGRIHVAVDPGTDCAAGL